MTPPAPSPSAQLQSQPNSPSSPCSSRAAGCESHRILFHKALGNPNPASDQSLPPQRVQRLFQFISLPEDAFWKFKKLKNIQLPSHLVLLLFLKYHYNSELGFSPGWEVLGIFHHGASADTKIKIYFLIKYKGNCGGFKLTGWFGLFSVDVLQELGNT